MTCSCSIQNSVNVQCSGNRYIHPAMSLKNKCEARYYAKGPIESKCNDDEKSRCVSCSCDPTGSVATRCEDQTGQCQCKVQLYHENTKSARYYGTKCENRDCKLCSWTSFSR